jgi:hypothetical protein
VTGLRVDFVSCLEATENRKVMSVAYQQIESRLTQRVLRNEIAVKTLVLAQDLLVKSVFFCRFLVVLSKKKQLADRQVPNVKECSVNL